MFVGFNPGFIGEVVVLPNGSVPGYQVRGIVSATLCIVQVLFQKLFSTNPLLSLLELTRLFIFVNTMAAPYQLPSSTHLKPDVPKWIPAEPTRAKLDWAQLDTIYLSLLDSPNQKVVFVLVATTRSAMKDDRFLYVVNYGASPDQLHSQFDLAQYTHTHMSHQDKEKLLWDPSKGTFAGYKPGTGWKREPTETDGIEHFNFYAPQFRDHEKVPQCIRPFMDEITSFSNYLTHSVIRRLLVVLSRVLELDDDWLWNNVQSHNDTPVADGYFRHALYYPLDEKVRTQRRGEDVRPCRF